MTVAWHLEGTAVVVNFAPGVAPGLHRAAQPGMRHLS